MAWGAEIVRRPVGTVDAGVSLIPHRRHAVGTCDRSAAAAIVALITLVGRLKQSVGAAVEAYTSKEMRWILLDFAVRQVCSQSRGRKSFSLPSSCLVDFITRRTIGESLRSSLGFSLENRGRDTSTRGSRDFHLPRSVRDR